MSVISLYGNNTSETKLCRSSAISINDREFYNMTFYPTCWVKTTCTTENVQHIVYTILIGILMPTTFTTGFQFMLVDMTIPIRISIIYFVYIITLTFTSSLTEIKWSHVQTRITK